MVWNHFEKTDEVSKVKCSICSKLISRGGKQVIDANTSNMSII